jgi:hypothetical protein
MWTGATRRLSPFDVVAILRIPSAKRLLAEPKARIGAHAASQHTPRKGGRGLLIPGPHQESAK